MRLRIIWVAVLLVSAMDGRAESVRLQLDQADTKIEFTLADVLHTVHGNFKLKQGVLIFDTSGTTIKGSFVVSSTSGESGSSARDSRMHKNILESMRFPEIIFTPDRFTGEFHATNDSQLTLHGIFRLHGTDHEINLPARVHMAADQLTADADLSIPYVAWGLKNPSTLFLRVGDTVAIHIHASGHTTPAIEK